MSGELHERDLRAEPPTIDELRDVMDDVRYEIENHGSNSQLGRLCADAHAVMRWLVNDYLWSTKPDGTRDGYRRPDAA